MALAPSHTRRTGRPHPRRRLAATAATAALLAALVWLAVTKIDLADVGHALARVGAGWIAAAVACMAGAFLARGESWHAAIRRALPDQPIGRAAVTRVLLIGMAGSAVAPARVGEAARAWLLARRAGGPAALAVVVGTLLSQTLLNLLALALLTVVAVSGSALRGARGAALAPGAAVAAAAVLVIAGGPALAARADRIQRRPLRRAARWVRRQLIEVRRGVAILRSPRTAAHCGAFQLGAWALQLGSCYAVLLAFGLQTRAGVPAAAAVLVAVNITAAVPVTPSNVGIFQAACIAVLAPFGVSAARGLAYGLVLQAVEVGCALALGLPSLAREGVSFGDVRRRPDGAGCGPPAG